MESIPENSFDLELVAAVGQNAELGYQNSLAWHLPSDLKHFKKLTKDSVLIMGRKTFESLPGLLPGRVHVVLTTQSTQRIKSDKNVYFVSNVEELFCFLKENFEEKKLFVIGGAQIYDLLAPYASKAFITHVQASVQADCFFPMEHLKNYPYKQDWPVTPNLKDDFDYTITCYSKIPL